jgi:hypothetical protein
MEQSVVTAEWNEVETALCFDLQQHEHYWM